VTIRSVVKIT